MPTCEWSENPCPHVTDGVCTRNCFPSGLRSVSDKAIRDAFPLIEQQQAQHQGGNPLLLAIVVRGPSFADLPCSGEAFEGEENPWAADQGF